VRKFRTYLIELLRSATEQTTEAATETEGSHTVSVRA